MGKEQERRLGRVVKNIQKLDRFFTGGGGMVGLDWTRLDWP